MGNALVWTSLGVTVVLLAIDVFESRGKASKRNWIPFFAGLACVALALLVSKLVTSKETAELISGALAAAGAVLALADFADSDRETRAGISVGPVAVLLGVFGLALSDQMVLTFGLLAGLGAGAAVLSTSGRGRVAQDLAVAALLGFAVNFVGKTNPGGQAVDTAQTLIAAALIALLIGEGLRLALKNTKIGWPKLGTAVVFGLVATVFCSKVLADNDSTIVVGVSLLLGLLCSFAVKPEGRFSTSMTLLAGLSWLGVASVAFGNHKAYGVALAGLVGFLTLLLTGQRRLLPVLAPIGAFIGYRMLKQAFGDVTSNFEISQHYAILGLIAGIGVPILAAEAGNLSAGQDSRWRILTPILVGIASLVVVAGMAEFLGDQGGVGLVLGLGVSPIVAMISGKTGQATLAIACGFMAWTSGFIGSIAKHDPIVREGKVWILATLALTTLLCGVLVWFLNRPKSEAAS